MILLANASYFRASVVRARTGGVDPAHYAAAGCIVCLWICVHEVGGSGARGDAGAGRARCDEQRVGLTPCFSREAQERRLPFQMLPSKCLLLHASC
jgi:hypothetical protein